MVLWTGCVVVMVMRTSRAEASRRTPIQIGSSNRRLLCIFLCIFLFLFVFWVFIRSWNFY